MNIEKLLAAYYAVRPEPGEQAQRVAFGTSGHRGTSLESSFNEDHILAIAQAIVDHRISAGIDGPLFVGMDTHALSRPARDSALEVFAANNVPVMVDHQLGFTPTPVVSHAILSYNRDRRSGFADGVVITPSHNPPEDGGFKYNATHGGPAATGTTSAIERRANEILEGRLREVTRIPLERAMTADTTHLRDYLTPYISDLENVVDMKAIAGAGLRIGADPMGGAGVGYWQPIAELYGLDIEVVNKVIDPTFSFMPRDHDGKIRMDCSSAAAMSNLIQLKDRFDIAFGNDPDFDRHGIVTSAGLMNPNHYLAVCVSYLFQSRKDWGSAVAVGKTLVSGSMIDRVAADLGRRLYEVPVGFKWFVEGLMDGSIGFAGEESAGASFLRQDGTVWTTDKDGFILNLLAAEIMAKTGSDPSVYYAGLEEKFGRPVYERIDAPAAPSQKSALKSLTGESISARELAGEEILARLTHAPGNDAPIGGIKIVAENAWFAARPSGTEDIYKIYAESFLGADHLHRVQNEAKAIVAEAFVTNPAA